MQIGRYGINKVNQLEYISIIINQKNETQLYHITFMWWTNIMVY